MKHINMKISTIIFVVWVSASLSHLYAQNTKLSSYDFGEGFNFTNPNGSTIKLQGYIQPSSETEIYEDSDD
jgi:hypothetical protein